jgi:hypothetical protein
MITKLFKLVCIILLLTSCNKDDDNSLSANFFEFDDCFSAIPLKDTELVISSEEEYLEFQELTRRHFTLNCENAELPKVNFDTQILMGVFSFVSSCNVSYKRSVYYESNTDSYTYAIAVSPEGACEMLITSFNCAIVPKQSESTEVAFSITYK